MLNLKALQDEEHHEDESVSSLSLSRESSYIRADTSLATRDSSFNTSQPTYSVETEIKMVSLQFSKKILDVIGYLTFKFK